MIQLKNKEVRIEPTNLCNYNCIMCPREKHTRKKGIMSMELYCNIIDQIVQMGANKITLTNFGEPFIDPTLEEKILIAKQNGLKTYVVSNASLFSVQSKFDESLTKIESAIKNGLDELRLSFYGFNKSEYELTMKGGNFNSVIKNIALLGELKEKYKSIEVSHFILDFNGSVDIEKQPDIIKDVIDYYEIWKPHNFGNGRAYREINNIQKKSCGRPQNGPMQINWSGIVVPCCYDYNESIILGDASKQTLAEILQSEIYESLRESHNKNEYFKFSYCNSCDQLLCNKKENSIVYSTNPVHKELTKEDIVSRTNTSPEVSLIRS
jgi:MoaA/NifB/PqqE/SkfB family radical SAM enzyme